MEESEQKPITIKLVNKEGKTHEIVFDHKITAFGGILKTLEETQLNFSQYAEQPQLLEKVLEFFKKHNYDKGSIVVKRPMVSKNFKDNVDAITYDVLKGTSACYLDYDDEAHEEEAVKMIALAEYLCIVEFKNAVYSAVASKFFIGSSEEDLEKFREEHNLHELSVDEEEAIIKEYPGTFDKLQQRFQAELVRLEKELPNN